MKVDFHTHSTASDGSLSPVELVQRALGADLEGFAITDHDTLEGYRQARDYCRSIGANPGLVSGAELSSRWGRSTIHVVGLGLEPAHPTLLEGMARLARARTERAEEIARRLAARGFPGALAGAEAQASGSQIGRPHFAAWMVEAGHVGDRGKAFRRHLGRGKPGDVKAYWPAMTSVIQWIVAAGGVPVLAHPLKYGLTRIKLRALVADFVAAGGAAIEVVCGRQSDCDGLVLRRLAREFGLAASAGSDFHADSPWGAAVGVDWRSSEGLCPVWERLDTGRRAVETAVE